MKPKIPDFLLSLFFIPYLMDSLHSSPGLLPQTVHSPMLFFNIGLLVAQVPLNSLPVNMWRILMSKNEMPKNPNTIDNTYKNSIK